MRQPTQAVEKDPARQALDPANIQLGVAEKTDLG